MGRKPRNRPRLTFRPTARGWQAVLIGAAVLVVARVIGTTQFYQLGYVLLLLPLAALLLGYLGSRGIRFSRSLPPGVHLTAGKGARIDLLLSNDAPLGTSRLEVADRLPGELSFDVRPLEARGGEAVEVPVTFARRGVYELGPAEVRSADPFALLRFSRRFTERTEVVVYPEVHGLGDFPLGRGTAEAGTRGAVGRRGDEFVSLREYRHGDDRRHIHWKSVARTGELYVREFSLHAPRRYAVVLDLRRRGIKSPEREVEDAVSAAASVLAHLLDDRLPARLICTNKEADATDFGPDEDAFWRAMRVLATVRADGDRPPGEVLLDERDELGDGVVLISRTPDENLADNVRKLRASGLSVVVVALATHTYRPGSRPDGEDRETAFLGGLARLEAAGADVRVVRHPAGVAGLAGRAARAPVGVV